jgi:hypothetical protein
MMINAIFNNISVISWQLVLMVILFIYLRGVMVVTVWLLDLQLPLQSVSITINVVSSNPVHCEVYSITLCQININRRPVGSHCVKKDILMLFSSINRSDDFNLTTRKTWVRRFDCYRYTCSINCLLCKEVKPVYRCYHSSYYKWCKYYTRVVPAATTARYNSILILL